MKWSYIRMKLSRSRDRATAAISFDQHFGSLDGMDAVDTMRAASKGETFALVAASSIVGRHGWSSLARLWTAYVEKFETDSRVPSTPRSGTKAHCIRIGGACVCTNRPFGKPVDMPHAIAKAPGKIGHHSLAQWFDARAASPGENDPRGDRIDWLRAAPFIALHLGCVGLMWVGVSPVALVVAAASYAMRMFALTGFYHRYFAHRTFHASRPVQFVFALLGAACVQRGPLWWAAHHRNHHRNADTALDPHSPGVHGFLWSHMGWFLTPRAFRTDLERVPDLARFPSCAGWTASTPPCRVICAACAVRARCVACGASHLVCIPAARRCWCGASSSRPWCCSTPR